MLGTQGVTIFKRFYLFPETVPPYKAKMVKTIVRNEPAWKSPLG